MANNKVNTRSLRKPAGTQQYLAGLQSVLPRQQFILLYRELGYQQAVEVGEQFIRWPKWNHTPDASQVPPEHILQQWAYLDDQGQAEIQPEIERAFKRRWENYAKAIAIQTIRGTSQLSRDYTALASQFMRAAKDGKIDKDTLQVIKETTSLLMHANNGTGFIYRELVGTKKQDAAPQQINNFLLNAGPPPPRKPKMTTKRIKEAIPATIDAEFREVPVGNG